MSDTEDNQGNPADIAARRAAREAAANASPKDPPAAERPAVGPDGGAPASEPVPAGENPLALVPDEPPTPYDPFVSPTPVLEPLAAAPPMESTLPWPSYVSHKVVQAAPIVHVSRPPETDGPLTVWVQPVTTGPRVAFVPTEAGMAARAEDGGYAILYPDGFK